MSVAIWVEFPPVFRISHHSYSRSGTQRLLYNPGKMHGRLKVKSPEHIEKERALAKQKKLEGYKNAMATIFSLRGQEPSPERDLTLLKITEGVLLNNPAISTLWNIRRQILIQRIDKR